MWIPLVLYVGMTIVVPLLNGAPADDPFIRHAAIVLSVSAFAALAGAALKYMRRH